MGTVLVYITGYFCYSYQQLATNNALRNSVSQLQGQRFNLRRFVKFIWRYSSVRQYVLRQVQEILPERVLQRGPFRSAGSSATILVAATK